ncbi:glycoside hydrolase family 3 C-terminal domain-containing protein [Streptomyces fractus]|uniref:glycoside hydrolase family 3 C-terminal domain-containing protein n=1 Tax=Streptomyces fractus TaxID=641806 RepID=UPI003CE9E819
MHPLVAQMTLKEKASLLSGESVWSTAGVDRLGIRPAILTDGPHGVRYQATTGDSLTIYDSRPATAFPTASATGSTWDPELLREMGEALGRESRALGVDVLLGPGVNMKRSPLCGRNFEYFSEDPLLSGVLGAAWVNGVQSQGVGASVKHFAANNQETERQSVSAVVDERTLREIYLPAFERVVTESRPATVMCSYNRVNGVFSSENRWLLTDILRDQWGFDGYVVSDWGAAVQHPVRAVAAGTDLAMPVARGHAERILAAVEDGSLEESVVDRAVSRVLTVHDRIRDERGPEATGQQAPAVDWEAHHALARRIASDSTVLLVNDGGLLPLSPDTGGRIAVVGEFARTPRFQGGGSSHITPTRVDTALDALRRAASRPVTFAPGFRLDGRHDPALVDEAVAAARAADVVVLFLGLPDADESEGSDREHLDLPAAQLTLVEELLEAHARVVVVLANGSVVTLRALAGRVPAILETWLGGQASGSATADVLFGAAEPSGRLAETLPLRLADTPAHVNWPGTAERVLYGERLYIGYRWYDRTERDVQFPFGHGLSYTTFSLTDVEVTVPDPTVARATVEVTVTNTGERHGAQVVQVYVGDPVSSVDRPVRELKGFTKVRLAPSESRKVRVHLDERAFAYWDEAGWTVEPGTFRVEVGVSSRDIHAVREIHLDVPAPAPRLNGDSSIGAWMAHPVGGPLLEDLLTNSGSRSTMLHNKEIRKMAQAMPLSTALGYTGTADLDAAVADLVARVTGTG